MEENHSPVALVTGGAKRVGRAIVERLAASGHDIAFTYLSSASDAAQVVSSIEKLGRKALAIVADLSDADGAARDIADQVTRTFGRLDVLVNNASSYEPSTLDEVDSALLRRMWAIHAEAPMLLAQRLSPLLRQRRGHIVNMLDLMVDRPSPKYVAYCASKAALANLTLSLARELAPEVTVNGIAPGVVEWPPNYPADEREKYLRRVPLGRAGTPQDVAATVQFLCAEGSYLTGQIIRLDGGRSIT